MVALVASSGSWWRSLLFVVSYLRCWRRLSTLMLVRWAILLDADASSATEDVDVCAGAVAVTPLSSPLFVLYSCCGAAGAACCC